MSMSVLNDEVPEEAAVEEPAFETIKRELLGETDIDSMGVSPNTWLESIYAKFVDLIAGRGGVEGILGLSDSADFIYELTPLGLTIKNNSIFYERCLTRCSGEMLKRKEPIRRREIYEFLGCACSACGRKISLGQSLRYHHDRCPCGNGVFEPIYETVADHLFDDDIKVDPEIVLMYVAHDNIAEAYVACLKVMRLIMEKTAGIFGWDQFRLENPEYRDYLDRYYYGRLRGETKVPREEKAVLQFIVRANLANIPLDVAECVIRLGVQVVKWGYLYQILGATGAGETYNQFLELFTDAGQVVNSSIRKVLVENYVTKKRESEKVIVNVALRGVYPPCLLVPRQLWESGQLSKQLTLEPVYKLPVFPKADAAAIQAIYGPSGSGKTFLMCSLASYGILSKHELVFSLLNDETSTFSLACMPLFAYSRDTSFLVKFLKETLGVEPQGVPTITLTFLKPGEKIGQVDNHPPTIYDRVVVVENPRSFEFDLQKAVDELAAVAEQYGFKRPVGIIGVRNLSRVDENAKTNIDVEVATQLLHHFNVWRKNHMSIPMRVFIDEVSYLAPSQSAISDAYHSGQSLSDFAKEARRDHVAVELATQVPIEIMSELRNASTNVFFRDLAMNKDKARSPIDFLLESLQLKDQSLRFVARDINNRKMLKKGFWFWYHAAAGSLNIIKPCPPSFCIFDPEAKRAPKQIFKRYEKLTGSKILLESWRDVKVLGKRKVKEEEI